MRPSRLRECCTFDTVASVQQTAVSADQLTDELFRFLTTTMKTAQGEVFRVVGEFDLTMTQLKILFVLDNSEGEPTQSEIAKLVGLSPAATGRALDALVRQDVVTRHDDAADRRVKRLSLTDRGREAVTRISAARREGLRRLIAPLDPEQRAALSAALAPLLTSSPDGASCAETSS
jgi:DNA-binding MarR family transcriptional regulator